MWELIKKKSENLKATWKEESQVKKRKPSNCFTRFWNIFCHRPAALFFFLEKEVQRLHNFSLKFWFHTKPSSTDIQNIETNCNGIKLHWWKFKLLYKWNGYQLDVLKEAVIYQKQAWKIMQVVWLMTLQLIQCNCRVLLKWKGLLGFFSHSAVLVPFCVDTTLLVRWRGHVVADWVGWEN